MQPKIANLKKSNLFISVIIINALMFLVFNMSTVGYPLIMTAKNASDSVLGLVVSSAAIAALSIRLIANKIIKHLNHKRALIISALGMLLLPMTSIITQQPQVIIALRCVQGLSWGIVTIDLTEIIGFIAKKEHLSEYIGIAGFVSSLFTAFASPLSSVINERIDYRFLIYTIASIALISFVFVLLIQHKITMPETEDRQKTKTNTSNVKHMLIPALSIFIITVSYSPIISFLPKIAKSQNIHSITLFFVFYALFTVASRPIIGRYVDNKGFKLPSIIAFVSMIIAIFSLGKINYTPLLAVSGAFAGLSMGAGMNTFQTQSLKLSKTLKNGSAISIFFFCFDLGMAIGPLLFGVVLNTNLWVMVISITIVNIIGVSINLNQRKNET